MNIYKRMGEGLHFPSFTETECEVIISVFQYIQSLCYGETSEKIESEEHGITIYSFDLDGLHAEVTHEDGYQCYSLSIGADGAETLVFQAYAEPIRPEFYDYIVWTFHEGEWIKELERLTLTDCDLLDRKNAFRPLNELAFK